MATFLNVERVKYRCSCGVLLPFCRLYLCKHCLKLRCQQCVSHGIEGLYCPNCLDIIGDTAAKLRNHRCANCMDCPSCGHTLATRATSVRVQSTSDPVQTTPKKMYYLACNFCRWTTRDGGIPDQSTASGWKEESEHPFTPRIKSALQLYHQIAYKEEADSNRQKYNEKRQHYSEKYLSAIAALPGSLVSQKPQTEIKETDIPSEIVSEFAPLSNNFFTTAPQTEQLMTLDQSLRSLTEQARDVSAMHPHSKPFLIRKSYRCQECHHNISKPDFTPMSIKFKILMCTLNHVPEVRLMNECHIEAHKECAVVLTLTNMTIFNTLVKLLPCDDSDPSYTATVKLPECELMLGHCDHTLILSADHKQQAQMKDDRSVVVFRNANKIGIVLKVTPKVDSGSIYMGFKLVHDYRNTTQSLTSNESEIQVEWLTHDVFIHLGDLPLVK